MSADPPADPAVGLGQIQAADPAFDLELFKRNAVEMFLAVKQAVEEHDLSEIADKLSDRVYDDLSSDIESLEARDAAPDFEGLVPSQVLVAAASRGPQGDAITLRIQAVAMQYLGAARQGDLSVGAPGAPAALTEFWTFSRSLESTAPSPRPNECPTCGAPIDINTGRICHYCRTLLQPPHAQLGWELAAIQPAQENLG